MDGPKRGALEGIRSLTVKGGSAEALVGADRARLAPLLDGGSRS
jgi:hypothetical protein